MLVPSKSRLCQERLLRAYVVAYIFALWFLSLTSPTSRGPESNLDEQRLF